MCVWHIGSIFFRSGVFGSKPPLLITIPCSQLVGMWQSLSGHARSDLNFEVNYPWLKIVLGCVTSQDSSATKTYKLTLKGGSTLVMPWKGISVILSLHILPPNVLPPYSHCTEHTKYFLVRWSNWVSITWQTEKSSSALTTCPLVCAVCKMFIIVFLHRIWRSKGCLILSLWIHPKSQSILWISGTQVIQYLLLQQLQQQSNLIEFRENGASGFVEPIKVDNTLQFFALKSGSCQSWWNNQSFSYLSETTVCITVVLVGQSATLFCTSIIFSSGSIFLSFFNYFTEFDSCCGDCFYAFRIWISWRWF
jgi:hypothetical protein